MQPQQWPAPVRGRRLSAAKYGASLRPRCTGPASLPQSTGPASVRTGPASVRGRAAQTFARPTFAKLAGRGVRRMQGCIPARVAPPALADDAPALAAEARVHEGALGCVERALETLTRARQNASPARVGLVPRTQRPWHMRRQLTGLSHRASVAVHGASRRVSEARVAPPALDDDAPTLAAEA